LGKGKNMGQRGPQPKPTILKLLQGNPGKRPINLGDGVNPEVAIPDAPRHLNKEARKEWKRISAELYELGLISRIDRAALSLYCQSWGRMVELEEVVGRQMDSKGVDGLKFYTPKGYEMQTVEVQLLNAEQERVYKYLQMFGLSPSSRSRVKASSPQAALPGLEQPQGFAKFAGKS
jgi:P27 family predicted phage terminase small subunit